MLILEENMKLFEKFPRPWRIEQDESVDPDLCLGGFTIFSADGQIVINGGTYTGDGDAEFNLNRLQATELVVLVNASGV